MKKINENSKVTLTLKQLKRLVKESFDDEAPEVAYTVRNNAQTFSHSDRPKEYGTYHTEEDAEKMRQWLAKEDPEGWNPKHTEVVQKDLDPMLPIHWSKVADLDEAKKVKQPRYTIAQYCDMKGLDADKLMAAMKAHWSILSPPLTDRSMFLMSALDTYAERYADEMNNADTPIEVQADDEAEDEVEVEVDKPYRDCGVTIHTAQGDREYGMKDYSETKWFDSKDDLKHWIECGIDGTDGSEQDRFYGMLDQLDSGIKVVDYNEVNEGKLHNL